MLGQKSLQIIEVLIRTNFVSIREIENRIGLTRRQIDYNLEKINSLLIENGYPEISKERRKGVFIPKESKSFLIKYISDKGEEGDTKGSYIFSEDERLNFIFLMLFINEDYTSLNHFIYSFNVSKSTAINDLKKLETQLECEDIFIHYNRQNGYELIGEEKKIRSVMFRTLANILSYTNSTQLMNWFIDENEMYNFDSLMRDVTELAEKYSIKIVDNRLRTFVHGLNLLINRINNSKKSELLRYIPRFSIGKSKEIQFVSELLETYNINRNKEKRYLSAWVLGSSMGYIDNYTKDRTILLEIIEGIVNRFERLAGIEFKDKSKVITQLYSHLRPAYYRLLFKLPIDNPMVDKIKAEYNEIYRLVDETLKPLVPIFGRDIPPEEIAYLTIHFCSIINDHEKLIERKIVALIVCPNGIGTSAILMKELKTMFPDFKFLDPVGLEETKDISINVDIIFSTIASTRIIQKETPLVVVNPIMTNLEKSYVIREVYEKLGYQNYNQPSIDDIIKIIERHTTLRDRRGLENDLYILFSQYKYGMWDVKKPMLSEITNERLIKLNIDAADWKDAIKKAGNLLVKENKVSLEYVQAMIESASESGPYIVIAKHVALPHARPECGSKEVSISIITLKNPVKFGNEKNDPVKYVFCLSAIDNDTHLVAMAELVELLDKEDFYKKLESAKEPKEIYQYIKNYEKEGMTYEKSVNRM